MTTIAVVRKGGAVALAADTLTKDGTTKVRAAMVVGGSKILRVGDSLVAYTGSAAWGNVLRHYFARSKEPPDFSGVEAIFAALLRLHPVLKRRYAIDPDDGHHDEFEPSRFHMLIVNPRGAFIAYPDRTVSEVATFYALGAGYRYALGAMHTAYPLMESAEAVAQAGVEAAVEFDEDTGGPVEVHRVELADG